MVVDTSVVLAVVFGEEHGRWAVQQLNDNAQLLRMSTVNLTEVLILVRDRQPQTFEELEERILASSIRFVPPDVDQAKIAARARLRYPLNLGDCFAYALAVQEGCPILAVDSDFRSVDCPVILPPE